jgi:hypothetical protein
MIRPRPRIPCKLCDGQGHREIDALHWETLQQLSETWTSTGAIESAHQPSLRRTTLVERLNWLVRAGLVEGQKDGIGMRWRRIDRGGP